MISDLGCLQPPKYSMKAFPRIFFENIFDIDRCIAVRSKFVKKNFCM